MGSLSRRRRGSAARIAGAGGLYLNLGARVDYWLARRRAPRGEFKGYPGGQDLGGFAKLRLVSSSGRKVSLLRYAETIDRRCVEDVGRATPPSQYPSRALCLRQSLELGSNHPATRTSRRDAHCDGRPNRVRNIGFAKGRDVDAAMAYLEVIFLYAISLAAAGLTRGATVTTLSALKIAQRPDRGSGAKLRSSNARNLCGPALLGGITQLDQYVHPVYNCREGMPLPSLLSAKKATWLASKGDRSPKVVQSRFFASHPGADSAPFFNLHAAQLTTYQCGFTGFCGAFVREGV